MAAFNDWPSTATATTQWVDTMWATNTNVLGAWVREIVKPFQLSAKAFAALHLARARASFPQKVEPVERRLGVTHAAAVSRPSARQPRRRFATSQRRVLAWSR